MNESIEPHRLAKLTNYLTEQLGLNFAGDRLADLEKNLDELVDAFNFNDVELFMEWMVSHPLDQEDIEILAEHLTVGETYFFRDPKAFAVLENEILPELLTARRHAARFLRIWSAGCCTGEEPYSLAMMLTRLIPDIENWQIKLIATDINSRFLEKARQGTYGEWSFRATESEVRDRYFQKLKKGGYQIMPQIRRMVQFEWLNLADLAGMQDPIFACMDIIFCRNVFIYFQPSKTIEVISHLNDCLINNGYLFVGPNELPNTKMPGLRAIHRPGVILLQKAAEFSQDLPALTNSTPVLSDTTDSATVCLDATLDIPSFEEAALAYADFQYKKSADLLLRRCSHIQDFASLTLLAKSFANLGDTENALLWCESAIKANRLNPNTYYLQATILQERGDLEHSAASLRQAIGMNSQFVLAQFTLGNLLRQSGNLREAQHCFQTTLKLLEEYKEEDIVPESGGTTANGLKVIVSSLLTESLQSS